MIEQQNASARCALLQCFIARGKHADLKTFNLIEILAGNSLQIAVHAGRRIEHSVNLSLALCPEPGHGLAFSIEIFLHVGEFLDNRFDAIPKAWTREVLVDHSHLCVSAVTCLAYRGDFN